MAIVTTYVCDVSGKSSNTDTDFVKVMISSKILTGISYSNRSKNIDKLVHIDIAEKLGLLQEVPQVPVQPEVTMEGKLKALLEDYVGELVQNHLENQ